MDCSKCQGVGYVLSVETIVCGACDGTGRLLDSICICCNGAGKQMVEINVVCDICDGTRAAKPLVSATLARIYLNGNEHCKNLLTEG
jgi:DnaJ-class molecular chaperone